MQQQQQQQQQSQQSQPPTSGYVSASRNQRSNLRRTPAADSVSLTGNGQRSPPALRRGANHSTESSDARTSADSGIGGASIQTGNSVYVGGRSYPFNSSNGSGESSGSEARPLQQKSSSGSKQNSSTQHSTAEDWFNAFNGDVGGNNDTHKNFGDESPYYVPSQHSKKYIVGRSRQGHGSGNFNNRSQGRPFDSTEESNSDSFRSVIDDLTIKNQRLKKRLRKIQGLHGSSKRDHGQRVLEVRTHGLSDSKRGELEELLQRFVSALDNSDSDNQETIPAGMEAGMHMSPMPNVMPTKKLGGDSGYATISRSGSTSVAPSSWNSNGNGMAKDARTPARARLGAQSNPELVKMVEVVQRLEQLFTGRAAREGGKDFSHEQQHVSDVAKADDRQERLRAGKKIDEQEGTREASIMSPGCPHPITQESEQGDSPTAQSQKMAAHGVPEQRPTQPKDLDPLKEQVAEENFEYLTHLTESATKRHEVTEGGWVYLNLIINLAQLHTINVTPSFVKKAIYAISSNLELSPDGKMVRWGGNLGKPDTAEASNSDGSTRNENGSSERSSNGQRLDSGSDTKMTNCGPNTTITAAQDGFGSGMASSSSKFYYKPLFARHDSSEDSSSSAESVNSFPISDDKSSPRGSGQSVGPMVYFKGQQYYTDLSGHRPRDDDPNYESQYPYERFTNNAIGSQQQPASAPCETKEDSPLHKTQSIPGSPQRDDAMDVSSDSDVMEFSPQFHGCESGSQSPPPPMELEASGLGGCSPADNFAINVETRHYLFPDGIHRLPYSRSRNMRARLNKKITHCIPKSSINAFHETPDAGEMTDASAASAASVGSAAGSAPGKTRQRPSHRRPLRHELLSAKTLRLPPSRLPPASYIYGSPSATSSCADTDDDYEMPRSSGSDEYLPSHRTPAALPGTYQALQPSSSDDADAMAWERDEDDILLEGDAPGSSVATAGDLAKDWDDDDEEEVAFQFADDSEVSGALSNGVESAESADAADAETSEDSADRPNLKRSLASTNSVASGRHARKNQRTSEN